MKTIIYKLMSFITNKKQSIYLGNLSGIGIVAICKSNINYFNQTGGHYCNQSSQEGYFIPLSNDLFYQEKELNTIFTGDKYNGWCYDGIDEETANLIDLILKRSKLTHSFCVDRSKLKNSHEAWVYLTIKSISKHITNLKFSKAVLTWRNSD